MDGYIYFIILVVIVVVIMIIVRAAYNGVESANDKIKKERDIKNGKYEISEQESLADRFKK